MIGVMTKVWLITHLPLLSASILLAMEPFALQIVKMLHDP
jgi:hypothetical protein